MPISNDGFGQTELAMIPDNISQPIIAQMRFQWWKDAIKAVYQVRFRCALDLCLFRRQTNSSKGSPPKQPIALALYECQVAERIPQYHLQRIIDARVGFFP